MNGGAEARGGARRAERALRAVERLGRIVPYAFAARQHEYRPTSAAILRIPHLDRPD
jgi:hypothetical protein